MRYSDYPNWMGSWSDNGPIYIRSRSLKRAVEFFIEMKGCPDGITMEETLKLFRTELKDKVSRVKIHITEYDEYENENYFYEVRPEDFGVYYFVFGKEVFKRFDNDSY